MGGRSLFKDAEFPVKSNFLEKNVKHRKNE